MSATTRRRPRFVTLAALLTGALGVARLLRAMRRWEEADLYAELEGLGSGVSFPVPLDILLSAVWGVVLLGLWWGLWRLRPWAHRATLILLPIYAGFSFAWLAIFVRADYDTGRLPFVALVSLLGILLLWLIFTRRRVREAFTQPANGGATDDRR